MTNCRRPIVTVAAMSSTFMEKIYWKEMLFIQSNFNTVHSVKLVHSRRHVGHEIAKCHSNISHQSTINHDVHSMKSIYQICSSVFMCVIPGLLSVAIYWNSLQGEFVHDDLSAITTNQDVIGLSSTWDFLYNDFWGTALADPRSHKSYRPFTILTFKWNYAVSGLNPWSYHAVNIGLHSIVSSLLAWMCYQCLTLSKASSLLTASLFAIHPIHTEAVSGIVGRADILTTLFFLLTLITHHKSLSNSSTQRNKYLYVNHTLSMIFALLALAAKETGIAALPVAILWDFIRQQCDQVRTWKWKHQRPVWKNRIVISVAMTTLLMVTRITLLHGQLPLFSEQDNPAAFTSNPTARILTLLYLPAFNMGLLLAPILLSYDWQNGSIPLVEHFTDWRNMASIIFYTTLTATCLFSWIHRKRIVLWSAVVMVVPMLPACNLFYPVGFVVAERLLYLPSLGYCLMIGNGMQKLFGTCYRWTTDHGSRPPILLGMSSKKIMSTMKHVLTLMTLLTCTFALTFTVKTWTRNAEWANRTTLFTSGLRTLPNNAKMHYNYANLQKDEGHLEAAIQHYRQAIKLWPDYASAHNNLGTVLLARAEEQELDGRESIISEAEQHFLHAIRSHPQHVHAHYNLAILSLQKNNTQHATLLLQRCLKLNPNHREALTVFHWLIDDSTSSHLEENSFIKHVQSYIGNKYFFPLFLSTISSSLIKDCLILMYTFKVLLRTERPVGRHTHTGWAITLEYSTWLNQP